MRKTYLSGIGIIEVLLFGVVLLLAAGGCAAEKRELSPQATRAHAMNEVGFKEYRKGELKEALFHFQRALDLAEAADYREGAVRAHINLGRILTDLDHLEEAEGHLEQAFRIAEDVDDDALRFNAISAMGQYCYLLSRYEEAEEHFEEALDLADDLESREMRAVAANDLGTVYKETGRKKEAMEQLLEALFLYENIEDREISLAGRGSVSNNLAKLHQEQGKYLEAWDLLTTSLTCYQQLGDAEALVTCHANMGSLLEDWGKKSDALLRYERAFGVAKEIPNPRWMEISLEHILRLSKELGKKSLHARYTKIMEAFRLEHYGKKDPP